MLDFPNWIKVKQPVFSSSARVNMLVRWPPCKLNIVLQQQNLGRRFGTSKMHLSPRWLRLLSVLRRWFCCCDFLFIVTLIVGFCNWSMFCWTLLYAHSSIAIILMGKRELVALLGLSSWCLLMVERLFHAVPRGCLRFVIVVYPDHTHLLFMLLFWQNTLAQSIRDETYL